MQRTDYISQEIAIMCMGFGRPVSLSELPNVPYLLEYVASFRPAVEETIRSYSGCIFHFAMSDLAAGWLVRGIANDDRPCRAAMEVAKILATKNDKSAELGFPRRQIAVGVSRGLSAVQLKNGKIVDAVGEAVNRAMRLEQEARRRNVVVVIDKAIAESCKNFEVVELAPEVFSLVC